MNWIDKNFKDRLTNVESSYSSKVWAGVEKELFPEKRTAPSAIWLLFFAGLFTIPVLLLKDLDNRVDTIDTVQNLNETIKNELENSTSIHESLIASNIVQQRNNLQNQSESTNPLLTQNKNYPSANTPQEKPSIQKIIPKEEKTNFPTIDISSKNVLANAPLSKTNNQAVQSTQNKSIENKIFNTTFNIEAEGFNQTNTSIVVKDDLSKELVDLNVSPIKNEQIDNKSEAEIVDKEVNFFNRGNILKKGKKNNIRARIFVTEIPSLSPFILSKNDKDPCLDHGYNINRWYSEFYLLGGTALSNINAKTTTFNEYGQKRREDETPGFSYAAGYVVGYQLDGGPFIESGFEYSQYSWNLKYIDPNSVMNTTIITIDTQFVNTPLGVDTVFRADTTFRQDYEELSDKGKHRVIEIPLLIGMEFDLSKQFSLGIKTGVSFNLFAQSTGTIYDEELIPFKMENDGSQNPYYKSSFGMAFPINAQLYFHATNEIDVFFRGGIKLYSSSITRKEYGLRENLLFTNLGTGVRIKL